MTMTCTICNNAQRLEIDRALVEGKSLTGIAREYGVSTDSLSNHKENHLSRQLVQAFQKKELAESMNLMERIDKMLYRAEKIFRRNYVANKDDLALRALAEQRNTFELLCKIAAYLHESKLLEFQATGRNYEHERKVEQKEFANKVCDRLNNAEIDLLTSLMEKVNGRHNEVIVPYTPEKWPNKPGIIEADPEPIPFDTPNEEITLSEQSAAFVQIETEPNPLSVKPIKPTQIPGGKKYEVSIARRKLARTLSGGIQPRSALSGCSIPIITTEK